MLFRLRAQGNVAERAEADEYVVAGAEVEHRGKCAGEDDLACTQGSSERIHLVCEPNHRVDRVDGQNGGAAAAGPAGSAYGLLRTVRHSS